jgi:hypothetical protein
VKSLAFPLSSDRPRAPSAILATFTHPMANRTEQVNGRKQSQNLGFWQKWVFCEGPHFFFTERKLAIPPFTVCV